MHLPHSAVVKVTSCQKTLQNIHLQATCSKKFVLVTSKLMGNSGIIVVLHHILTYYMYDLQIIERIFVVLRNLSLAKGL